jgi:hypothetical protein
MKLIQNGRTMQSGLYCVGTVLTPIPPPSSESSDDPDASWRTYSNENIVPVKHEKFETRPSLITFDVVDTLIMPSQSIGRWYREALNTACGMTARLPRPQLFHKAFKAAYADM